MRDLTEEQLAATAAGVIRPVLLCRLDFESLPILVHSGVGELVREINPATVWDAGATAWDETNPQDTKWDFEGEVFYGVGSYGGISGVTEGSDARPYDIDLTLSGIPTEFLATTMGEQYQGRGVILYVALLNSDLQIIGGAKQIWSGYMDFPDIVLGSSATIAVRCRGRANDWSRPRLTRYTKEWLRSVYPEDSGLDYVAQMEDKSILWGTA